MKYIKKFNEDINVPIKVGDTVFQTPSPDKYCDPLPLVVNPARLLDGMLLIFENGNDVMKDGLA
jgi:hypothetical protein